MERESTIVNRSELLAKWQANLVPVRRFSEQQGAGETGNVIFDVSEPDRAVYFSPRNLPALLDSVLMEEPDAADIFYGYWEMTLNRFFLHRLPEVADDLTQTTIIKVMQRLPLKLKNVSCFGNSVCCQRYLQRFNNIT